MATPNSAYQIPNPHDTTTPFTFININNSIKLTFTNYLSWKLQLEAILIGHDLHRFVNGAFPCPPSTITTDGVTKSNPLYFSWIRQDKLLFGALLGTLSSSLLPLVSQAQTSQDLWHTLAKTYATPTRGHLKQLKDQFRKITKGNRSITEYMQSLKAIADQLASLGKPLDPEDIIERVLDGLDSSYAPVIEAINGLDTPIAFEELHEKLINKELSLAQQHDSPSSMPLTTFAAHHRSQTRSAPRSTPPSRSQPPLLPTPSPSSYSPKPFLGKC